MTLKERIKSPTPLFMKRLGDAMLAAGLAATPFLAYFEHEYIAAIVAGVSVLGKFVSVLFTLPEK